MKKAAERSQMQLKTFRKVLAALLLLGCVLCARSRAIQAEECHVFCQNLPQEFAALRIVQLSDLHGYRFGQESELLLKAVRRAKPDLICITGDLFDEGTELSMLPGLLRGLCALAPTFYVTGNHEWQRNELRQVLAQMEALGVTVLENEYVLWEKNGGRMVIAGVHDPCGPADQKTPQELMGEIRAAEPNAFVLMLAHRNDTLPLWAELGADLVLTGHCHGGLVRLPFLGGVFGKNGTLFPKYDAGLYRQGETLLYVSRGLGGRLRLCNRPHLPVLVLHAADISCEQFVNSAAKHL